MLAERPVRLLIYGLALCSAGVFASAEKEDPEVDFLEYLGMWEESDEDWLILDETTTAENEERSDPAPDGEESTEKKDES